MKITKPQKKVCIFLSMTDRQKDKTMYRLDANFYLSLIDTEKIIFPP